ncbi:MAG: aminotransferase class I/II-fold pyridoxal phosphate-dependent enzyme [Rhizobiaceae bacterium]|nr:aminotransferase class I/II-fold pyridoxal phosphate-dependent enzyme [Rhizobiaceae bacterium]
MTSLAQNESLRAPSPLAIKAGQAALVSSAAYPDPDYHILRTSISNAYGVDPDLILCGAGSMELITCITHAFAGPKARVLTSEYGYALFKNSAMKVAAPCDLAREVSQAVSTSALLQAVTSETRLCFLANPGNPTGTALSNNEIREFRTRLPEHVLLIVDEAYGEFAQAHEQPLFDLVDHGNTVILRTFSKAYGLAAGRIGWGLFPPATREQVQKLIIPSSICTVSAAMAEAAVQDQIYMQETCKMTAQVRDEFIREVRSFNLTCDDSHTNFVLIRFSNNEMSNAADAALRQQGLVTRGMGGYGLGHCLRVTVAAREVMTTAAEVLEKWSREYLR